MTNVKDEVITSTERHNPPCMKKLFWFLTSASLFKKKGVNFRGENMSISYFARFIDHTA